MANKYYVTDYGPNSTVTNVDTGVIVFTGPYDVCVSQAAELNRQSSSAYNQNTTVVQRTNAQPIQSAGQTAKDDAGATKDQTQTPNPQTQVVTTDGRITNAVNNPSGTNAVKFDPAQVNDSGTDAELRKIINTQATGGLPGPGPKLVPPTDNVPDLGEIVITDTRLGAGAGGEDSGVKNPTRAAIDATFSNPIVPKPNVLDVMASYTYNASLYLMDQPSYVAMMQSRTKTLNSSQLLISSAGAPLSGRNEYFVDDYYIDRIELQSFVLGGGTGMSHNVTDVRMTILEPNGITFLENLDAAVQEYLGGLDNKVKNFTSQIYLLVIRFYGYDDQGNLVRGGNNYTDYDGPGTSDANAFVEKWYPLVMKSVKFKIASKAVEYDLEAACVPYQVNSAAKSATIPFNIELSAQKVKALLDGTATAPNQAPATNTTPANGTKAPPKASAAPTTVNTVRQGLMAALNDFQIKLTKPGPKGEPPTYQYADEYSIEFTDNVIAEAKVMPPGAAVAKKNTSMASGGSAADRKDPAKQSMDPNSKNQSITAGTQLVQVIDQIIRNSTYIKEQQLAVVDPKTGTETPNGVPGKNVAWFKITMVAEAKLDQYDTKRNDYAYKIKYIVSPYKINQLFSPWFPRPKHTPGAVHKQYYYWFTGQNTSVLNYEETLNALYYIVLSNTNLSGSFNNELIKGAYQTRSNESSQGSAGRTNEGAASAAAQLYSPGDLKEAVVTIVGDPAWLQQGEAFVAAAANQWNSNPFLPDGTINFDSQQILFEIIFNKPKDYVLETGLVDVNTPQKNLIRRNNEKPRKEAALSRVYITKSVVSEFNRGKFTQTLKGALLIDYEAEQLQIARDTDVRPQLVALNNQRAGNTATSTNPFKGSRRDGITALTAATLGPARNEVASGRIGLAQAQAVLENGSNRDIEALGGRAYLQGIIDSASGPGTSNPPQKIVKDGNPG